MGTLTNFIDHIKVSDLDYDRYEVIENERITNCNIKEISISGVLFSMTTFVGVTFEKCDIFATRFENCEFIDCKFVDCTIQFSNILYSDFHGTSIKGCNWSSSPIVRSLFSSCDLDDKSLFFVKKSSTNKLFGNSSEFERTMTIILDKIAA
ncbi:MAG: pentapeptide repeat-containing protein [Bacteriovoracaceae bacterium]|nr:pentapeptide repeat-containing protein [Bacteriovoracaceae bacterium]